MRGRARRYAVLAGDRTSVLSPSSPAPTDRRADEDAVYGAPSAHVSPERYGDSRP